MGNKLYKIVQAPSTYPGTRDRNGSVYEHHLVWWQHTGTVVPKGFILHHKNEDKFDNRFENLELLNRSEHQREHRLGSGAPPLSLSCPICSTLFYLHVSRYTYRKRKSKTGLICCSKSCAALGLKRLYAASDSL